MSSGNWVTRDGVTVTSYWFGGDPKLGGCYCKRNNECAKSTGKYPLMILYSLQSHLSITSLDNVYLLPAFVCVLKKYDNTYFIFMNYTSDPV